MSRHQVNTKAEIWYAINHDVLDLLNTETVASAMEVVELAQVYIALLDSTGAADTTRLEEALKPFAS